MMEGAFAMPDPVLADRGGGGGQIGLPPTHPLCLCVCGSVCGS
eukprot:COSAG02_NODE_4218_length_5619_cov_1.862138_9_plen_42_part_01